MCDTLQPPREGESGEGPRLGGERPLPPALLSRDSPELPPPGGPTNSTDINGGLDLNRTRIKISTNLMSLDTSEAGVSTMRSPSSQNGFAQFQRVQRNNNSPGEHDERKIFDSAELKSTELHQANEQAIRNNEREDEPAQANKDALTNMLHNYVSNQAALKKLMSDKAYLMTQTSYSSINNLIDRVNCINYINSGVGNQNILSGRFSTLHDSSKIGGYIPKNNMNSSMLTLSPPQTLSPHNQSQNMSFTSLTGSPPNEESKEPDDENDYQYRNFNLIGKHKRMEDIYRSPSSFSKPLISQATPPLTPLNNNNILQSSKLLDSSPYTAFSTPNRFSYLNDGTHQSTQPSNSESRIENPMQNLNNSLRKKLSEANMASFGRVRNGFEGLSQRESGDYMDSHDLPDSTSKFDNSAPEYRIHEPGLLQSAAVTLGLGLNGTAEGFRKRQDTPTQRELELLPASLFISKRNEGTGSVTDNENTALSKSSAENLFRNENNEQNYKKNSVTHEPATFGVFVKEGVPRGTRFGPFLGKLVSVPEDPAFAWEVSELHEYGAWNTVHEYDE